MNSALDKSSLLLRSFAIASTICLADYSVIYAADRPNIIHIFADDLGKGGIGIHGQNARAALGLPAIQTPNLDALASAGMTFDRAYAATVCSPSRGMLMTGFHQGHGHNDRNVQSLRTQDITVAHLLSDADYTTSVFGKWGYGANGGVTTSGTEHSDLRRDPTIGNVTTLPTTAGYDEFLGYLNHGRAHKYFTSSLWTTDATGNPQTAGISELMLGNQDPLNQNNNLQATYTHDVIAARSEQFISDHYQDADPFYMQVNYTIPHNDLEAIQFVPNWFDDYSGMDTSTWTNQEKFYAAMITRMDSSIGSLIDKLEDPNGDGNNSDSVMDNSIIMFTSDNGATQRDTLTLSGLEHFGINDTYRGGKRDLWEGGINVPLIVRWDGQVAAGTTTDHLTDLTDFMTTAAELAGTETPVGIDGVSIVPTLTGSDGQRDRGYLIFEHHEGNGPDPDTRDASWAVVRDNQKLIRFDNGSYELFDLATDPSEQNPLSLSQPENISLRDELIAIAIAEGVNQPDSYANQFQEWVGANGDQLLDASKWNGSTTGVPASNWSTVVNNNQATASIISSGGNVEVLGLEVRGDSAKQTIRVEPQRTLSGHNEIRIRSGAQVHLDNAELSSNRWIDIDPGGEVTGIGDIEGKLNNRGLISPGLPANLPAYSPGSSVDTGVVNALSFDFTGVQDNAPLTQTSQLSEYLTIESGLNFGPGLSPRNAANAGNEFNVQGFINQTANSSSLANAITAEDYLTFTVAPIAGLAMTLDSVEVNLWRNGNGAAEQYAILTSLDGFTDGSAIGTLGVFDFGVSNQHTLTGQYLGTESTADSLEVRIYGWDANGSNGNTHFNAVSITASFESLPFTPLAPLGELALNGDYTQLETGILSISLAGNDNTNLESPEYDSLHVSGDASLDGSLQITTEDGYIPTLGTYFDIVSIEGARSGQFATTDLPLLPAELTWEVRYENQLVRLVVVPTLAGDYNADGIIDAADFTVWRDSEGLTGNVLIADGDGNGSVGQEDYTIWFQNFGNSLLSSNFQTVPEPTSSTSMMLSVFLISVQTGSRRLSPSNS